MIHILTPSETSLVIGEILNKYYTSEIQTSWEGVIPQI